MAAASRDTIYIDIDDEITAIIDKLRGSDAKVVALVLPKRAATLQSIVNMKLLKRAADESKKNVVLITSEAGLLPLAGMTGLHVAKTLNSKPEIPAAPATDDDEETVDEEAELLDDEEPELDKSAPVGALAGAAAAGAVVAAAKDGDDVETVELGDDDLSADAAASKTAAAKKTPKPKKDKNLKVPNFDRFRKWLIIGGIALVALIVLAIFAFRVMPKATIYIKTDASNVQVTEDLTLSTTAKTLDTDNNTLPAKQVSQQKTYTQQVNATGQQNNGQKASGTVAMSAGSCSGNVPSNVAAGTGLSSNGLTYILNDTVSFVPTVSHGKCTFQGIDSNGDNDIAITAQTGGAKYNIGNSTFTVSGSSDVTANGSASGGTDDIQTIVSQSDIDSAKGKISTNDTAVKQALEDQLTEQNMYPIKETFNAGTPAITTSASVGTPASSVTVTEKVTYTMYGVDEEDLKTIVNGSVKDQIDTSKQGILNQGLDEATFNVSSTTATGAEVTMQATAVVGPDLDIDTIKQEAAGKKSSDVEDAIMANPDVKDVSVKYSPFWVSAVPSNTNKITVVIAKPTNTSKSDVSNP